MNTQKMRKAVTIILIMAATMTPGRLYSQTTTPPPQTFSTTIYFDWTANVTNNGYLTGQQAQKDLWNQFRYRRAYFTYENKISDFLRFRFRLDADNTTNVISGNKTDDKLRPFMKHLYLQWTPVFLSSTVNIGMIETLSFKLAEDRWGLRSVAKTLVDGYKDVTSADIRQSSADIGFSWKGTLARPFRFAMAVYNGEGYSHPELNKFKKFEGYLQIVPVPGLSIFAYTDYEKQVPLADGKDRFASTYKIDGYFDMVKNLNVTAEWFTFKSDKNFTLVDGAEQRWNVSGWSLFATYKIMPEKFTVFARYDSYRPKSTDSNKDLSLVVLGCDWFAWGNSTRIQPNVWIYKYEDSTKKSDVVFNLTFFMSF